MNLHVHNYLDVVCTPVGYKDFKVQGETRDFRKSKKISLMLYDKCNEPSTKKYLKKNNIQPFNCLRIESRLLNRPQDLFKLKVLRYRDLYEKDTYNTLLKFWYDQYQSLPHVTNIVETPVLYDSKTAFVNSLAIIGIKQLGGIEEVEEKVRLVPVNKSVRFNIREYLKSLKMIVKSPFDLSVELNNKVEQIYYHYLAN